MINPFLCLNDSRSTVRGFTVPSQYSHRYPYIGAFPKSGDCISCDDQIPATPCKAAYHADSGYPVCSHALDYVLVPSWIIPLNPHHSAGKNSVLYVKDIQAVLGHFFQSMDAYVVLSKPNFFPYPFYP